MERTTLDFDRFLREKRAEYVTVTVFGKPCRVRREIPALLPVLLARAEESGAPAEMGKALLRAGDMLFGAETVDEFCRRGMSAADMTALVEKTLGLICAREPGADVNVLRDEDGGTPEGTEPKK